MAMMTCKEAAELMSRSLDAQLPWHKRLLLRVHLAACRNCARAAQHLRVLRAAAQRLGAAGIDADSPLKLSPEARRNIARTLRGRL
jgi:anti-sigma factor RsiW